MTLGRDAKELPQSGFLAAVETLAVGRDDPVPALQLGNGGVGP
jgi:hypothetical protein